MTYTLDQVREEIMAICAVDPDADGSLVPLPSGNKNCVYFHEGTPICLVGRWLALHPDVLELEGVREVVEENYNWGDFRYWGEFLEPLAFQFLARAQRLQDSAGMTFRGVAERLRSA